MQKFEYLESPKIALIIYAGIRMQMSYDVIGLFLVTAILEKKGGHFCPNFEYFEPPHGALLAHIKEIKIPKIRSI